MLDDPNYIAKYDRSNGLAMIAGQADQLRHQFELDAPDITGVTNIVLAGMGGSALAGEFIKALLGDKLTLPFEIARGYDLPGYVDEKSLVIISSYSGNTEETLSAFEQAKQRNAAIVVLTSGGKLAKEGATYGFALVPSGLQPRLGVLYGVKALATLFEACGLVDDLLDELETHAEWLLEEVSSFMANVDEADNIAKQVAKRLVGHPVVVYAGPTLAFPAMKWKIDINENSKNVAFWNQLPEFNHNEFNGWSHPSKTGLAVVELHSSLDNARIAKRFEVTNKLLSGSMPAPIVVEAHGETKLQQMLWTLLLGDFVSAYLAFLNEIDPIPVELIERLKKDLG